MKTILLVIGTRPEAVKMCPLALTLRSRDFATVRILATGQHSAMLDGALADFGITPDLSLSLMREGQSLSALCSRLIAAIGDILTNEHPDLVLLHGDTCTAFSTAIAAFHHHIPIGHVEAGLRTYNMASPFPEELYRQAIGLMATWHFAPTAIAREHLLAEGKPPECVFVTGNTVIDALRYTVKEDYTHPLLVRAGRKRLILITAHRRENLGPSMRSAFRAIRKAIDENPDTAAIFPVHGNPAVRREALEVFGGCERIFLSEPLRPADFHNLLSRCYLVVTDSGGIQEEAAHLCKPVLVLRDTTERPEGLASGNAGLVGTDECEVYAALCHLLRDKEAYESMVRASSPYGDGHACERIAELVERALSL